MFFIAFSILFVCGFFFFIRPTKSLSIFLIFISIYPSSTSMSSYNVFEGIYFYDGWFIGLIFSLAFSYQRISYIFRGRAIVLFTIFIVLFYFIFSYLNVGLNKYIVKDLRPLILLVEAWLLYGVFKNNEKTIIEKRFVLNLIIVGGFFNIVYLLYGVFFGFSETDQFYIDNSYRYLDISTYISAFFIMWYFSYGYKQVASKLVITALALSFICVLISNSRFMIISILLSLIIVNYNGSLQLLKNLLISLFTVSAFIYLSEIVGSARVLSGLNYDVLLQQIESRYMPALLMMEDMNIVNFIFGIGLGLPFQIPWFEYREGMDPYNVNIDSNILTMYIKYGFSSIFIFLSTFELVSMGGSRRPQLAIKFFLFFIYIVSATHYQIYGIGIMLGAVFIYLLMKDCNAYER